MYKRLRFLFKLWLAYVQKNKWQFAAGVLFGALILFILPNIPKELLPKRAKTIGLVGNYTISSLPISLQNEISLGLTKILPDGQATVAAAISYQATDSGKQVTFTLDTSLVWQDGKKFDADSVNYNLKNVTLTRPDPEHIVFNFKEPFAPLLTMVAQPLFKPGLVGLGEKKVTNLRFNGRFLSQVNLLDVKTGEKTQYKFYSTEDQLATALKLGAVREARDLHEAFGFEADSQYRVTVATASATVVTIFFNTQKGSFSEKSFRQGLIYALPDDFPFGEKAFAPIPRRHWTESSLVKIYRSKSASESAQHKIVLTTVKPLEKVARVIKDSWEKAGMVVNVVSADMPPSDYDAFLAYLDLPVDPDQYTLWHSTQTGNISRYKSPKVDKLLEEGRREINPEARLEIYADFQKAITEDAPAAFLFYPKLYTISRR